MALTVACVLRSGGTEYRSEHVLRLLQQVNRHLQLPFKFACLTDLPDEVSALCHMIEVTELEYNWPGWYAKLELFRNFCLDPPIFYIDLDTLIIGDITDMVLGHEFTVLRNFWYPETIGSGLMAWSCDLSKIERVFRQAPENFMSVFVRPKARGDQGFIARYSPIKPELWQDRFPGRVVSYRRHCIPTVPEGASIVCFGGPVRPWTTPLGREVYETYR